MTDSIRKALGATAICALALPATAGAAPTEIQLRVEGSGATIFEGPVTTDGHDVTTPSSGTHPCDGTNNGANPQPGPTPTAALDDGSKLGSYTWDGTWFDGFQDFLVDRVGPDTATSSQFWGQYVNSQPSQTGGCQEIVGAGDEVLWAYDAFSKVHVLRLAAPDSAVAGQAFDVTVTDGQNNAPVAGAEVAGVPTGADGRATVSFADPGVYTLKAERADSVRSNGVRLCVDPPGADPCSSGDTSPPTVTAAAPEYSSATRSGRFAISWQGDDGSAGSGVASYDLDVRRLDVAGAPVVPLAAGTRAVSRVFEGRPGATYAFRVTARDRAARESEPAIVTTTVPIDDLSARVHFGRGWQTLRRRAAFHGTVARSQRRGATATLRFSGSRIALIGRRLRRAGRVRITVDGRGQVVRLRGRPRHRRAIYSSRELRAERHVLRLRALGRRPVELDAVAVLP
jgi:hypothetical protein